MMVHMKGLDLWRRPIVTEDRKYGMDIPQLLLLRICCTLTTKKRTKDNQKWVDYGRQRAVIHMT
jgi:hypothetical protein